MKESATTALGVAARYAVVATGAGYILVYLLVALRRLQHPFELNWMEGAMVDHVGRIMAGDQIYVVPSLEFVPFIYPPLFYYVSAAVAQVTGAGFTALRLVSFVSSLGVFALIFLFVARETRDRWAALAAAGLFAATYNLGGAYLDVGRVDTLFLAVLLGALFVLRFHTSLAAHAAGGLLLGLAFLTKQSAVVMAAPVVLYVVYRDPRRGLVTAAVTATVALSATLLLDAAHGGLYSAYAFEMPSAYEMLLQRLAAFLRVDILPPLAVAWVVGLIYLVASHPGSHRLFYVAMATGMIAGSWLSRGNPGGNDNVLIPAFVALSILFGLGLHTARTAFAELAEATRTRAEAWLALACLLQFALLVYNPFYRLPTRADAEAGAALVRMVASSDGEVWVPYHGYVASMAGKRPHAHWMAITDVLMHGRDSLRNRLQADIDSALTERQFSLIVQSSHPFGNSPVLETFYTYAGKAVDDKNALWPVTGARRRAETLYLPK